MKEKKKKQKKRQSFYSLGIYYGFQRVVGGGHATIAVIQERGDQRPVHHPVIMTQVGRPHRCDYKRKSFRATVFINVKQTPSAPPLSTRALSLPVPARLLLNGLVTL